MAIDQDIAQRVNAYRGNPQALQQRYASNQELLDLLALQRLKSEKDDAMRKVQLEMQQDPQTIKQQKERQLLEMTKQDLTKQTAGIMQNAQNRQQKNMQNVAKKGAPSPQQMQQVQSGLGALAQRQQGQAPMRMAEGGIVAFVAGGPITQADIDKYRSTGGLGNISARNRMKMTDEQIAQILRRTAATEDSRTDMSKVREEASVLNPNTSLGIVENSGKDGSSVPITTAVLEEKDAEVVTDPLEPKTVVEPVVEEGKTETEKAPEGGLAAMLKENTLTAPQIDMTGINANQAGKSILSGAGIGPQNPNAAKTTARDDAASFLGRDKKADTMNNYLEQLKAMDVSQQDPKKLRDQEISAFLRGTAGGGSFGQTMAGGSQGMADERSAQEKSSRDRLLSRLGIEQSAMDMDMKIAESALGSGDVAYTQAMKNQQTIANVMATTRGQEVNTALKQAQLEFDANSGNVQSILKGMELEYNDALRKTIAEGDRAVNAGKILGQLQVDRFKFFQEALNTDQTYRNAQIAVSDLNPNDDNYAGTVDALRKAYNAVQIKVTQGYEAAGLLNTESALMDIIRGGGGAMPTQATVPSFELSEAGQAALTRNQQ